MQLLYSKGAKYSVDIYLEKERKTIDFYRHYYQPKTEEEYEALIIHPAFGSRFMTERDRIRQVLGEKDNSVMENIVKQETESLKDENEELKRQLELLKSNPGKQSNSEKPIENIDYKQLLKEKINLLLINESTEIKDQLFAKMTPGRTWWREIKGKSDSEIESMVLTAYNQIKDVF